MVRQKNSNLAMNKISKSVILVVKILCVKFHLKYRSFRIKPIQKYHKTVIYRKQYQILKICKRRF